MAHESSSFTHPLTPPLTEEEWLSWIRLLRSRRVGISTFFRLMAEHGSAAKALECLPEIAQAAGVDSYTPCSEDAALQEWRAARRAGATPVAYGSADYPARLSQIPDPPPFFWAIGDVSLAARPAIALVGARNASSLGTRMARKLATDLAKSGYAVISGLARGIDTAAHVASLETGTIAVLAGGVDVIYPSENAVLGQEIGEKGLLVSERPMNLAPRAQDFPRRNRIISGISKAVVVVEAAARSGSLLTARAALDQGREVLAVPGHPFDPRSAGGNMLLRDGAALVRSAEDVIEALAALATPDDVEEAEPSLDLPAPSVPADTVALHQRILDRLGASPIPEDQLIRDSGLPGAAAQRAITRLELDGRLLRAAGGLLSRPV